MPAESVLTRTAATRLVVSAEIAGLRLVGATLDEQPVPEERILDLEQCQREYETALTQHDAAVWHLYDVMGVTEQAKGMESGGLSSWHIGEHRVETAKKPYTVPTAFRVAASVSAREGALPALRGVTVHAYPTFRTPTNVPNAAYFSGVMAGTGYYPGSAVTVVAVDGCEPAPFAKVKQRVVKDLTESGRMTGVEALADAIIEQSAQNPVKYGHMHAPREGQPIERALHAAFSANHEPEMRKHLVSWLVTLFEQQGLSAFATIFDLDMATIMADQNEDKLAATERLLLIMDRLPATRRAVNENVRQSVTFGFKEAFQEHLQEVQKRTQFVKWLAQSLASSTKLVPPEYHPGRKPSAITPA